MRIASLVPSATELLFALGLGDSVVGVTHECDYPPEARGKPHLTRSVITERLDAAEMDRAVRERTSRGEASLTSPIGVAASTTTPTEPSYATALHSQITLSDSYVNPGC